MLAFGNPSLTVGAPIRATTVSEWFPREHNNCTVEELVWGLE